MYKNAKESYLGNFYCLLKNFTLCLGGVASQQGNKVYWLTDSIDQLFSFTISNSMEAKRVWDDNPWD